MAPPGSNNNQLDEETVLKQAWKKVRNERKKREHAFYLQRLQHSVKHVIQRYPPLKGLEQRMVPSMYPSTAVGTTSATSKKKSNSNNPPPQPKASYKPLTGAQPPLPPQTARAWLSRSYPVNDSPELKFVPSAVGDAGAEQSQIDDYFKLFDVGAREQAIANGPLHHVEAMNADVKETMKRCWKQFQSTLLVDRETMEGVMAHLADLEDERVILLYNAALEEYRTHNLGTANKNDDNDDEDQQQPQQGFVEPLDSPLRNLPLLEGSDYSVFRPRRTSATSGGDNTLLERVRSHRKSLDDHHVRMIHGNNHNLSPSRKDGSSRKTMASPGALRSILYSPSRKQQAEQSSRLKQQQSKPQEQQRPTSSASSNSSSYSSSLSSEEEDGKPAARATASADKTNASAAEGEQQQQPYQGPFCQPVKHPTPAGHDPNYLKQMDTYRKLWCSRCRHYDCLIHGMGEKPSLQLSYEIGMGLEREPKSRKQGRPPTMPMMPAASNQAPVAAAADNDERQQDVRSEAMGRGRRHLHEDNNSPRRMLVLGPDEAGPAAVAAAAGMPSVISVNGEEDGDGDSIPLDEQPEDVNVANRTELTDFQKNMCRRFYLIYEGDIAKVAVVLRAPRALVREYVQEHGHEWDPKPKALLVPKFKSDSHYHSLRNYTTKWYNKISEAGLRPSFDPCVHDEPCAEKICSCVNRHVFCTLACSWNSRSKNFYRGCDCRSGCNTNTCSCYSNSRECDPDLCRCDTCTDEAGQSADTQRCSNDNITMNRGIEIVIAPSEIPNAGWGAFSKRFIPKGTFLGEYVGEMISQEEADRRGQLYDIRNHSSLFMLTADVALDADRKGNKMRYVNHSSTPNTNPRTITVNGDNRIGFFALQDIEAQQELTFNYGYNFRIENDYVLKSSKAVPWMDLSPDGNGIPPKAGGMRRTAASKPAGKKTGGKASSKSSSEDEGDLMPMDILGEIGDGS